MLLKPGAVKTPIWDKALAASEELLEALPPAAQQLYGQLSKQVRWFGSGA